MEKERKYSTLNLKNICTFLCYSKTKCIYKGFGAFPLKQIIFRPAKLKKSYCQKN